MTRKDRTEGIYSRHEVLDESERRQYYLIQLKSCSPTPAAILKTSKNALTALS